jgi:hypothetical protein
MATFLATKGFNPNPKNKDLGMEYSRDIQRAGIGMDPEWYW